MRQFVIDDFATRNVRSMNHNHWISIAELAGAGRSAARMALFDMPPVRNHPAVLFARFRLPHFVSLSANPKSAG
jgi:hypothetical protein